MKIISKFSDYYDSGIAYGIDEKLRFTRKGVVVEEVINIKSPFIIKGEQKGKSVLRAILYFKILGFCGEVYPFIHIVIEKRIRENKKESHIKIDDIFSFEELTLEAFLDQYIRSKKPPKSSQGLKGYNLNSFWGESLTIKTFLRKKFPKAKALFFKYKVPYFVIEEFSEKEANGYSYPRYKMTLLPVLKTLKFAQVKSAIDAFQEISMFLGRLNTQEDNMVTIEDKYLAQAKGFDCYSFKKEPEKKPRKKC